MSETSAEKSRPEDRSESDAVRRISDLLDARLAHFETEEALRAQELAEIEERIRELHEFMRQVRERFTQLSAVDIAPRSATETQEPFELLRRARLEASVVRKARARYEGLDDAKKEAAAHTDGLIRELRERLAEMTG